MNRCRILWLLLIVGIAGCTALRFGYRQADVLIAWRTNQYFDLDADQRREFGARLDRQLQWHRYDQLPEYAAFLSAAIEKARAGLKHDDIVWFVDGFKKRYRVIVEHGAGDAAAMLATVKPKQLEALQKQWDKDNRKFVSEYALDAGAEKRKRARLKHTLTQIEDWTGTLTYDQEQKIGALLEAIPLIEHLRHQDRIRRQREFAALLKLRANKPDFEPALKAWLLGWDSGRAPEYERLADEVYEKRIQFYIALDKLLTPGQRQIALRRLQDYVDDCKALSQKRAATAAADFS